MLDTVFIVDAAAQNDLESPHKKHASDIQYTVFDNYVN